MTGRAAVGVSEPRKTTMIKSTRPIVLLLEDEAIIAIDIEDMLRDEGALIGASIDNCADALVWLSDSQPDFAIVDPRLKDGSCGPVVHKLIERNIPFIVYSGDASGASVDDAAFQQGFQLGKPSRPEDMVAAMVSALSGRPTSSIFGRSVP